MKSILAFTFLILFSFSALSQSNSRYQTYKSVMNIIASKQGDVEQWKNDRLSVVLDYKTGDFLVKLENTDFIQNSTSNENLSEDRHEYTIEGIFPIRDIINQKSISQNYVVELQLINYEQRLNYTIMFDLNVTNPGTNQAQYRIFMLQGKLYNNEANLPAFEGYDNEIEMHFGFNGYIVMN